MSTVANTPISEDAIGLKGYNALIKDLLDDAHLGKKCTQEDSVRAISPENHGVSYSTIYSDFSDNKK